MCRDSLHCKCSVVHVGDICVHEGGELSGGSLVDVAELDESKDDCSWNWLRSWRLLSDRDQVSLVLTFGEEMNVKRSNSSMSWPMEWNSPDRSTNPSLFPHRFHLTRKEKTRWTPGNFSSTPSNLPDWIMAYG